MKRRILPSAGQSRPHPPAHGVQARILKCRLEAKILKNPWRSWRSLGVPIGSKPRLVFRYMCRNKADFRPEHENGDLQRGGRPRARQNPSMAGNDGYIRQCVAKSKNRFILAETAETGAEIAENRAMTSQEFVFVSALSAPVSAVSARIPSTLALTRIKISWPEHENCDLREASGFERANAPVIVSLPRICQPPARCRTPAHACSSALP
jgi:hypothetical protein